MAQKRSSLADKAYDMLQKKILQFELAPGIVVSDHLLCQELGMSRTPVREALVRLEQDGLISSGTDNKMVISHQNINDIEEIYQARMAIECKAAELCIRKGGLSDAENSRIEKHYAEMLRYHSDHDEHTNYAADDAFHLAILESAGNKRLIDFFNRLRMQIIRTRYVSHLTPGRLEHSIKEHKNMLDALQSLDEERTREAINYHLEVSLQNCRNILCHIPAYAVMSNAYMAFQSRK